MLPFLLQTFQGKSRTTVKSYLSHRQVMVNDRTVTQFNALLRAGDTVTVFGEKRTDELRHPMLRIVYEDDDLIVADKQYGLLSMGTDREQTKTAFYILSEHVKRVAPENRIFIVHRLDRDTSGLMVFAKSEKIKRRLQDNWNEMVTCRRYAAVVEGQLERKEGQIATYLTENKGYKVFVSNTQEGERAVTYYRVLSQNDAYSLVEVELKTGKKNQIRAHMEYIGHSIAGDKKYGAATDPIKRVALHACKLCFTHPRTGVQMAFESPVPGKFTVVLKPK